MTAVDRHRTRQKDHTTGMATMRNPVLDLGHSNGYTAQDMRDTVGNRTGVNNLYLLEQKTYLWTVDGASRTDDFLCIDYVNYTAGGYLSNWPATVGGRPSVSRAYAEGLALTNPNRPKVDVPVFLAELRDIPKLMKDWGEILLRFNNKQLLKDQHLAGQLIDGVDLGPGFRQRIPDPPKIQPYTLASVPANIGKRYLEWQFGVAPYFRDMARMVQIALNVDKKFNVLKHLQQGSSHRHATVWSDSVALPEKEYFVSSLYQEYNKFAAHWEVEGKTWVATTWVPLFPGTLPKSDDELRSLALRLSSGWDVSLATLWEAFPWSWMIDWFGNIGDIFSATRNAIPVDHKDSSVMESTVAKLRGFRWTVNGGPLRVRLADFQLQEKKRTIAPLVVYPEFSVPLFDGTQLSILSALVSSGLKNARVT